MNAARAKGFSLVEVAVCLAIGALLLAALNGVALHASGARANLEAESELQQQAQFALDRMLRSARLAGQVLVPRPERASTAHSESVRNVLAVPLDSRFDRDGDGVVDADNDGDGRVNEDFGEDITKDGAAGIVGIDDDGDGFIDEGDSRDDDEGGAQNEDKQDGADNDADGLVDEDVKRDMNDDGKAGIKAIDDDGDGSIDEGAKEDDDEDGAVDEDWLDIVAYRLSGTTLLERFPNANPANGNAFTERAIAEGVSQFRVEYIPPVATGRPAMVDITLTLVSGADTVSLNGRARIGGL